MECLNKDCDATEIEKDDNFCYKCGYWTTRGYKFLKDEKNIGMIENGETFKQSNRLGIIGFLFALSIIIFTAMFAIRGDDLFKPFFYLKRQALNYAYGYNTTLIKTTNKYKTTPINSYEEAISIIKRDFEDQEFYCFNDYKVKKVAISIEEKYAIPSVSFCDLSIEEATKIENVIERMYSLFPNIKGALTNITITNAASKDEYIARFQPMYQFVNIDEKIDDYNKVNKTQILLNSYYFLNKKIINNPVDSIVGNDWYVNDATWESTIAHEFGHYISFLTLLKSNGINNITLVTKENTEIIDKVLSDFDSGTYSITLVNEALNNYNTKYGVNLSLEEYASSISKYASSKDKNNNIIADETIAEAIHDYYLHGDNMKLTSKEIVDLIKAKL